MMNSAHIHTQAMAHIRIMNVKRNVKGSITAITHQNVNVEIALPFHDIIITSASNVYKGVIDVKYN